MYVVNQNQQPQLWIPSCLDHLLETLINELNAVKQLLVPKFVSTPLIC